MRIVSLSMLEPDMVLAKAIYHNDYLILSKGMSELNRFADSLRRLGIEYVYVEDSKSEGIEIPDAISEETRVSCKRILRKTMEDFENNSVVDITDMVGTINDLIDEIMAKPEILVSLNDIGTSDEYTFSHSVSTTVYSLLIAKQLDYSKQMMEKLAVGTLLHDMGKIFLDKKIMNKLEQLTEEEYIYLKTHTTLGYEALKKCSNMTELSRIVSLYHHERMDGTGYPTGTAAGELHEFTRIAALADVYDALTTNRIYRRKWSANQAVNYLIENAESKFDLKLVSVFIKQIAIYPNGSMVRLSNNAMGIVKEQNKNFPLRPVIRVFADEKGNEIDFYELDLLKELSVTIIESELEMSIGF